MTGMYFPTIEELQKLPEESHTHIIAEIGDDHDTRLKLNPADDSPSVSCFFRSSRGGRYSSNTCNGIANLLYTKAQEEMVDVPEDKTIWRPADDGGGFLALRLVEESRGLIMTLASAELGGKIGSCLVTASPDIVVPEPSLAKIILRPEIYSRFANLPGFLIKDWGNIHGDPYQAFKSTSLGKACEKNPKIFGFQVHVGEKIDTILAHIQTYHT